MLLTALIVLPLLGAIPLLLVRDGNAREIKVWAIMVSLVTFLVSLPLWFNYDPDSGELYQFVEHHRWIHLQGLRANFSLGVDGFATLLILLTTFIMPIALLGSWNYIKERQKEFYIAMLGLEAAMIGVFAATDLLLFYVFFEASLIPMYLLIGIWGGENRIYATTKFVLYTVFGSLLMFVAILFVYHKTGGAHFGIAHLAEALQRCREADPLDPSHLTLGQEIWCFWAFALAFAIKIPLFPLHTWLPDAHVEAPTPGSVILASVLLKMGGYGFLRLVVPFFPHAAALYAPFFMWLSVTGIVYGSLMAFAQQDVKKLIAYSSVAHMGTCLLGIFSYNAIGIQGGAYQMLNHGISTGALFLLAGMLYERTHTRMIDYYGGIAKVVPVMTVCFVVVTLSSIGLPLTNGFVGEFSALLGAFLAQKDVHSCGVWYAALGGLGVILGAVYMLSLVKRVFYGKVLRQSNERLADLSPRELGLLLPLLAMIFVMGLQPSPFFRRMEPAVRQFLTYAQPGVDFAKARKLHAHGTALARGSGNPDASGTGREP
ncbi:MAG: NADH-quinone oxidoreductase subunit M [Planctomycetota bacterium]|nr:NADH-quinone oxidoreductase subunit M [Planctomycetota bacterium]